MSQIIAVATACGRGKRPGILPALGLYTSSRIKAVYNRRCKYPMFVLSSEYGLIPVDKKIASYDRTMDEVRASQLAYQAASVLRGFDWLIYYRTGAREDYASCIKEATGISGTNLALVGPPGRYLLGLDIIPEVIDAILRNKLSALTGGPHLELILSKG